MAGEISLPSIRVHIHHLHIRLPLLVQRSHAGEPILKVPSVHEKLLARYCNALRSFLRSTAGDYLTLQPIDARFQAMRHSLVWPYACSSSHFPHAHDTRHSRASLPHLHQFCCRFGRRSSPSSPVGSLKSPPVRCVGTASTVGIRGNADYRNPRFPAPIPAFQTLGFTPGLRSPSTLGLRVQDQDYGNPSGSVPVCVVGLVYM